MGADTKIEWARHTFNPWVGCTKIAHKGGAPSACDGCYAAAWAKRTGHPELWEGERRRTTPANWRKPLKWDKTAAAAGERHTVFCASLADVFDNQVDPQWRADLFTLIRSTPNLIWLLLTKRPQNIVKMVAAAGSLPPNVALGTTVEDQPRADQRVPVLLEAKAKLNPLFVFLSCEPLLGPIDLQRICPGDGYEIDAIDRLFGDANPSLDWIIVGGESGPKARPMHPQWARDLREQCKAADVRFFFKQWGEWVPHGFPGQDRGPSREWLAWHGDRWGDYAGGDVNDCVARVGKKAAGRLLDGREHNEMPTVP